MVQNPFGDEAVTVSVGADTSQFTGAIDGAIAKMGTFKGAVMAAGGALAILGAGAMVKATRQAMELETAFSEVSTLMDEGADAAQIYGDDISRLTTRFAVHGGQVETVSGLYQVLSAGFTDSAEAVQLLEQALKLGQAGLADTETSIDVLTSIINAYGLEVEDAERISDILFETVRQGKTTLPELGSAMGRAVPIAAELGVSFEEVGAATATLTAQGQSTDEAVTAVRQSMVSLLKPSADAQQLIEELGYKSGRALVEAEGFAGAIQLLKEQAEETGVPFSSVFNNVRAMQAVFPLAGRAAETYNQNLKDMENSAGATDRAFEKMSETAQFQLQQSLNEVEVALAETGNQFIPLATKGANAISTLVSDFNDLNEASDGVVGAVSLIATTIGGLALVAGGPITLAIAAVGALAYAYGTNFAGIRDTVNRSMNDIAAIMDRTLLALTGQTETELGKQKAEWREWGEDIVEYAGHATDAILTDFVNKIDRISVGITNLADETRTLGQVGAAVGRGDFAAAGRLLAEQEQRSTQRVAAYEERATARREAVQLRSRLQQQSIGASTYSDIQSEIAGTNRSQLQEAIAANNAQAISGGSGGGAGATAATGAATVPGSGSVEFQREATAEVARIWNGIEEGDVVTIDVGLLNDLRNKGPAGGATASKLGLTPEEFTRLVNADRAARGMPPVGGGQGGGSGGGAAPASGGGGVRAVTGGVPGTAVSTFDRSVTRFKDAVDDFADTTVTVVLDEPMLDAKVDGRIEVQERRTTDRINRYGAGV